MSPVRMESPPVERIVPEPITFESVVEWLRKTDERARLVEFLADDLVSVRSAARTEAVAAGHAEGHAEGKAEGLLRAREQATEVVHTLESIVSKAEQALQAQIDELGGLCAEVVCVAIAKIAGPVLSMREAALGTVLEVLKRVKDDGELLIRVSAHDLAALQGYANDIERACGGRKFSLVADTRVQAGGCIVDTPLGSLDGRFEVQLRALSESLRAAKAAMSEAP
jgi:flagellar assembly protein FliH